MNANKKDVEGKVGELSGKIDKVAAEAAEDRQQAKTDRDTTNSSLAMIMAKLDGLGSR